jgi:hypothetical protein
VTVITFPSFFKIDAATTRPCSSHVRVFRHDGIASPSIPTQQIVEASVDQIRAKFFAALGMDDKVKAFEMPDGWKQVQGGAKRNP